MSLFVDDALKGIRREMRAARFVFLRHVLPSHQTNKEEWAALVEADIEAGAEELRYYFEEDGFPRNLNSKVFWTSGEREAYEKEQEFSNYRRVIGLGRQDIQRCGQLADTAWLGTCTSIEHLDLKMSRLTNVAHLSGLTNLRKLGLERSHQLADIAGLAGCVNLRTLDLYGCTEIVDISALGGCVNLRELVLKRRDMAEMTALFGDGSLGMDIEWTYAAAVVKSIQGGGQAALAGVNVGAVIVAVSERPVAALSFDETMALLQKLPRPMSVRFCTEPREHYRRTSGASIANVPASGAACASCGEWVEVSEIESHRCSTVRCATCGEEQILSSVSSHDIVDTHRCERRQQVAANGAAAGDDSESGDEGAVVAEAHAVLLELGVPEDRVPVAVDRLRAIFARSHHAS